MPKIKYLQLGVFLLLASFIIGYGGIVIGVWRDRDWCMEGS